MKNLLYKEIESVVSLIEDGHSIGEIVDSYGRPLYPHAVELFSCHKQAKRMTLKHMISLYKEGGAERLRQFVANLN